ncbi:hypothetical protein ALC53_09042 [Atta colombica]|uniref:Uncharacterized protein n=1 Tax=Atta colombica TaxID=520822 RepID=A0A195B8C2_9HYME|nr:hypothetical protein ALC53_09042 [Atta colombica]
MPSQVDASLIKMRSLLTPSPSYKAINLFAFSILASLLKDNLASTSVETLPGIIFKISLPNKTHVISRAASTYFLSRCMFIEGCSFRLVAIKENRTDDKKCTQTIQEIMIAKDVANPFNMLSAYLTTIATINPPPACKITR